MGMIRSSKIFKGYLLQYSSNYVHITINNEYILLSPYTIKQWQINFDHFCIIFLDP